MARSDTGPLSEKMHGLAVALLGMIPSRTVILIEPGERLLQPHSSTDDPGTLSQHGVVQCADLRKGPLSAYIDRARVIAHADNSRARRSTLLIARDDAVQLPLKELDVFRPHIGQTGAGSRRGIPFDLETYARCALRTLINALKPESIHSLLRSPIEQRPQIGPPLLIIGQTAPESDDPPLLAQVLAQALDLETKHIKDHLRAAEALLLAPGRADYFCRIESAQR